MQAVGRFWAQLENVRARWIIEWHQFHTIPDHEYVSPIPGIRDLMNDLVALRRYEQLKTLSEHRSNFFTVIFPQDDRINPFRALAEPSMDGRNLSWYAYKRGIDTKRIRNIHWEDGHMVMDIMLSWNADESQIRDAGDALILQGNGPAPGVIRFSQYADPTSFSCAPGVQVVETFQDAGGEQQSVPIGQ